VTKLGFSFTSLSLSGFLVVYCPPRTRRSMKMGSCSSKVRVNKGKAPAQPPQSRRNEGLGDLTRMHNRAIALMKQGKLAEATEVSRQVLERSRTVLGPEHPDTLSRMFALDWRSTPGEDLETLSKFSGSCYR
jgi:hypothetical protein